MLEAEGETFALLAKTAISACSAGQDFALFGRSPNRAWAIACANSQGALLAVSTYNEASGGRLGRLAEESGMIKYVNIKVARPFGDVWHVATKRFRPRPDL